MILNLVFLCSPAIFWSAIAGIGAFVGAIIAGFYTYFTFQLLTKTSQSLNLSTEALNLSRRAIELNEKTLESNNKLTEYQIYKEFGEKMYTPDVLKIIADISKYPAAAFCESDVQLIKFRILNHLEDLAKFYEDGLISIKSINSGFGTVVLYLGKSESVKQIIRDERRVFKTLFSGFENLYEKVYDDCSELERGGFEPKIFSVGINSAS